MKWWTNVIAYLLIIIIVSHTFIERYLEGRLDWIAWTSLALAIICIILIINIILQRQKA